MRPHFLLTGLCLLGLGLPAGADALLEKAKSATKEGPAYLFDMVLDDGSQSLTLKVDPTRPEGERVVAMNPALASLEGDAAKRAQRLQTETKGDIWCANFTDSIPDNARRISETASAVTYSFTPLPGEDKEMRDVVKHLTGKATLEKSTGNVLTYELTAPKAFKPAMVAKVDQFNMRVACKVAPDGRSHIDTYSLNVSGTAMMQAFNQRETRRVTNLRAAPQTGFGAP